MLECVYWKHSKHHLQHSAEAGDQATAGEGLWPQLEFLISDAVECYVADQERMRAEIRQADRQVKSGHYITHEDMKAWLLSWGTDHEMPLPNCVCGKQHEDEALCR